MAKVTTQRIIAALGVLVVLGGSVWLLVRTESEVSKGAPRVLQQEQAETSTQPPSPLEAEDIEDEVSLDERETVEIPAPLGNPSIPAPSLPSFVQIDAPFASQSPYGDWDDPRQQDGCEEASLAMASYWRTGKWLTKSRALEEVLNAFAWQETNLGGHPSLSMEDTLTLARDYFGIGNARLVREPTIAMIRAELAAGNVLVVPANGQALGNPYFTSPGPPEHMLLIIGYDDERQQFITHDPGTRHGAEYRYGYTVLYDAIREYPTGHREPIAEVRKSMLVIPKS